MELCLSKCGVQWESCCVLPPPARLTYFLRGLNDVVPLEPAVWIVNVPIMDVTFETCTSHCLGNKSHLLREECPVDLTQISWRRQKISSDRFSYCEMCVFISLYKEITLLQQTVLRLHLNSNSPCYRSSFNSENQSTMAVTPRHKCILES